LQKTTEEQQNRRDEQRKGIARKEEEMEKIVARKGSLFNASLLSAAIPTIFLHLVI